MVLTAATVFSAEGLVAIRAFGQLKALLWPYTELLGLRIVEDYRFVVAPTRTSAMCQSESMIIAYNTTCPLLAYGTIDMAVSLNPAVDDQASLPEDASNMHDALNCS